MRAVDLSLLKDWRMPSGIGSVAFHTACVVAQANIVDALSQGRAIGELTDELDCACPVLRILAIALNDTYWWLNDEERTTTLLPLIPLLLDSRREPSVTAQRGVKAATFAKAAAKFAAKSAAEDAKYAAKAAAKFAAKSAKYAAEDDVEAAANYAKFAAEDAKFAAKAAAKFAAKSAAKFAAKYAAASSRQLRDELLKTWHECEAIQ